MFEYKDTTGNIVWDGSYDNSLLSSSLLNSIVDPVLTGKVKDEY